MVNHRISFISSYNSRLIKSEGIFAGDAPKMWWIRLSLHIQPHNVRWCRNPANYVRCRGRVRLWRRNIPDCSTSLGKASPQRSSTAARVLHAPRVRTSRWWRNGLFSTDVISAYSAAYRCISKLKLLQIRRRRGLRVAVPHDRPRFQAGWRGQVPVLRGCPEANESAVSGGLLWQVGNAAVAPARWRLPTNYRRIRCSTRRSWCGRANSEATGEYLISAVFHGGEDLYGVGSDTCGDRATGRGGVRRVARGIYGACHQLSWYMHTL